MLARQHVGEWQPGSAEFDVLSEELEHDWHWRGVLRPREVELGSSQMLQQLGASALIPISKGLGRESQWFVSHARYYVISV
jgi:hypothetical protein